MTHRLGIEIEEPYQYFADDAGADGPEPIATSARGGLPKNVVPERCFVPPANGASSHFVAGEGRNAEVSSDRFARGKTNPLSALEVAHRQRVQLLHVAVTSQDHGQRNERTNERAVDLLRAIGSRFAVRVEQPGPLDAMIGRHRPETDEIGKDRDFR